MGCTYSLYPDHDGDTLIYWYADHNGGTLTHYYPIKMGVRLFTGTLITMGAHSFNNMLPLIITLSKWGYAYLLIHWSQWGHTHSIIFCHNEGTLIHWYTDHNGGTRQCSWLNGSFQFLHDLFGFCAYPFPSYTMDFRNMKQFSHPAQWILELWNSPRIILALWSRFKLYHPHPAGQKEYTVLHTRI